MMKKIIPAILICALGGVVVLGLSGCFVKKYRVDYCGSKDCYTGAKDFSLYTRRERATKSALSCPNMT